MRPTTTPDNATMSDPASATTFHVRLLGPLAVSRDGMPLNVMSWRRGSRRLLLALATAPEHGRFRGDLIHTLWPDAAYRDAGATNLRVAVHELRRGLRGGEPSPVVSERGWVGLAPAYRWEIDFERFESLLAQSDDLPSLREAMALLPSEPLRAAEDEPWLGEICERMERGRREAVLRLAQLYRDQENPQAALAVLKEWLERDPVDETVMQHLLELSAAMGQGSEGFHLYERFTAQLHEQRGRGPTSKTEALVARLTAALPLPPGAVHRRPSASPSNLPAQVTGFAGREREMDEISCLLRRPDVRLLTLTGFPGVGKTRLALEVAEQVRCKFPDGVFSVPLAPVGNPELVTSTIASALGVQQGGTTSLEQALIDHLRDKELLLLLDNFEHLRDAACVVSDLLRACPKLTILVTSREILHLYGEYEYVVPPLPVPDPAQERGIDELRGYGAIALFVQRAEAARNGFGLCEANAEAVARICAQLEGLPLAIELAASRMRSTPVEVLLPELQHRLELLIDGPVDADPRHQTLRRTLDWSYGLLNPEEQALFRRLAVFAGGWTLDAAEAVCEWEAGIGLRNRLASLVDKHLLRQEGERFAMLETMREYAAETLEGEGETERTRTAHARYFLRLAQAADAELGDQRGRPQQRPWLAQLDAELDNLRGALDWFLERGEAEEELRLAEALSAFWRRRGFWREEQHWLEAGLREAEGLAPKVRGRALLWLGRIAVAGGDHEQATARLEESLTLLRAAGDGEGTARVLSLLGVVAHQQGTDERAAALWEQALKFYRERGDPIGSARTLGNLGELALAQGNLGTAMGRSQEALALFRDAGDVGGVAFALQNLAAIALHEGKPAQAEAQLEESLALAREVEAKWHIGYALQGLGEVAVRQGQLALARERLRECLLLGRDLGEAVYLLDVIRTVIMLTVAEGQAERAAVLQGAEAGLQERLRIPVPPIDRAKSEEMRAWARTMLGENTFTRAWKHGLGMSVEEVLAYVLVGTG